MLKSFDQHKIGDIISFLGLIDTNVYIKTGDLQCMQLSGETCDPGYVVEYNSVKTYSKSEKCKVEFTPKNSAVLASDLKQGDRFLFGGEESELVIFDNRKFACRVESPHTMARLYTGNMDKIVRFKDLEIGDYFDDNHCVWMKLTNNDGPKNSIIITTKGYGYRGMLAKHDCGLNSLVTPMIAEFTLDNKLTLGDLGYGDEFTFDCDNNILFKKIRLATNVPVMVYSDDRYVLEMNSNTIYKASKDRVVFKK